MAPFRQVSAPVFGSDTSAACGPPSISKEFLCKVAERSRGLTAMKVASRLGDAQRWSVDHSNLSALNLGESTSTPTPGDASPTLSSSEDTCAQSTDSNTDSSAMDSAIMTDAEPEWSFTSTSAGHAHSSMEFAYDYQYECYAQQMAMQQGSFAECWMTAPNMWGYPMAHGMVEPPAYSSQGFGSNVGSVENGSNVPRFCHQTGRLLNGPTEEQVWVKQLAQTSNLECYENGQGKLVRVPKFCPYTGQLLEAEAEKSATRRRFCPNTGQLLVDENEDSTGGSSCSTADFDACLSSEDSVASESLPASPVSPTGQVRKIVQSLLNKICPENIQKITRQVKEVQIADKSDLEALVGMILNKAVRDPHYCETYADLILNVEASFPELQAEDGSKVTFRTTLLNACQKEFDSFSTALGTSSDEEESDSVKSMMRATCKFLGYLFLRRMIPAKVLSLVLDKFLPKTCAGGATEEHFIHCTIDLMLVVGSTLEQTPKGLKMLETILGRLSAFQEQTSDDGSPTCSKRVRFVIQDTLDTRAAGWSRRMTPKTPKTKHAIKLEQERDPQTPVARARQQTYDVNDVFTQRRFPYMLGPRLAC